MKVVNLSTIAQQVAVILPDGRTTSIRIMPKARVGLADGQKICPNWVALNPGVLKMFEDKPAAPSTPAPTPAVQTKTAAPVEVRVKNPDPGSQGD